MMTALRELTIDPVPAAIATLSLAALWSAAAVHKLADPKAFERSLEAYEVAPRALAPLLGRLLPMLELATATGLVFAPTRAAAGGFGALLLTAYGGAIALNLGRGRRELDCGCMGFGSQSRISPMLIWRNAIAAIASLLAGLLPRTDRATNWIDAWTIMAGIAMVALLYLAMEALRAAALRLVPRE